MASKFAFGNGRDVALTSVPGKIKCSRCDVVKDAKLYSNKRLLDLKAHLARNPRANAAAQGIVPCTTCTGGQRVDHTCSMCDKSMSIEKFSKAQLKRADDAICIKCSNERNAMGPGGAGRNVRDSDDSSNSGSDEEGSDDCGTNFGSSTTGSTYPSRWGMQTIASSASDAGGVSLAPTSAPRSIASIATASTTATAATRLPLRFGSNTYRHSIASNDRTVGSRDSGFAMVNSTPPPLLQTSEKPNPKQPQLISTADDGRSDDEGEDEDEDVARSDDDWEEKFDLRMGR